MYTVNFWPILVASIVAFVIGAFWYSPILFGKEWMQLNKMSESDVNAAKAKGVWKLYIVQFVVTLISFCILGFLVGSTGMWGASNGAFLGFFAWIGFTVPIYASNLMWEGKPWKLVMISGVCTLLTLVVGGAIIGGWGY